MCSSGLAIPNLANILRFCQSSPISRCSILESYSENLIFYKWKCCITRLLFLAKFAAVGWSFLILPTSCSFANLLLSHFVQYLKLTKKLISNQRIVRLLILANLCGSWLVIPNSPLLQLRNVNGIVCICSLFFLFQILFFFINHKNYYVFCQFHKI